MTDTDALRERLAEKLHYGQGHDDWGVANDDERGEALALADEVLPTIAAEVRKARSEVLREAADEDFYDGDMDMPVRGYAELYWRADQIEAGDTDEHR